MNTLLTNVVEQTTYVYFLLTKEYCHVISVVEFQSGWVLENKIFGQKSTYVCTQREIYSKETILSDEHNELQFVNNSP